MKIAVLGGGNGAHACAADLSEQGHEVRWWRRNAAALSRRITVKDQASERAVDVAKPCPDIGEAVRGAELIFMPDPAFTQEENAARLAPHLADGQVVFLAPGTFGSYVLGRKFTKTDVALAETGTLPWLTRKHGPGTVAITARATRLPTGIFPAKKSKDTLERIKRVFPVEPVEDALSAALMNAGPVIHPPLVLMNAGPLEHFERWDIHNEGTQPAIRRVTDALDAERIAAREALGYAAPHFPLADHYRADGEEWMYGRRVHKKLTDSKDWRERIVLTEHRYVREDIALGLAFLVSVCEWTGVACPVARGLLALGSAVLGRDLRSVGRTLESLQLAHLKPSEMKQLLHNGLE
jgi:opine dehydrogenase